MRLEFTYESDVTFPDPEDWTVEISTNGSNWINLGSNGRTTAGWGSGLIPLEAGYYTVESLNSWAGETVFFRTIPNEFGQGPNLEISNKIIHFVF